MQALWTCQHAHIESHSSHPLITLVLNAFLLSYEYDYWQPQVELGVHHVGAFSISVLCSFEEVYWCGGVMRLFLPSAVPSS